jgi:hypothetical protein
MVVPATDLAPSETPWAIFSVFPVTEWYAINSFTCPLGV